MFSASQPTYKSLIRPIAPSINLANIVIQEPCRACSACAAVAPDRRRARNGVIKLSYERIDLYPEFPDLKASAKAGCGLCRLLRKNIRINWGIRPMEEWGIGAIREDPNWAELLASQWDRKVRIHDLLFSLKKPMDRTSMPSSGDGDAGSGGMVLNLSFQIGPATRYVSPDGTVPYGDIGQLLSFIVFDSQDTKSPNEKARRILPSLSTLSNTNIELILRWISECKSLHDKCNHGGTTWMPTRLLDVGPADGSELPRLVETARENIQAPYAALSHMWGGSSQIPPLRTLVSKYEAMKSGIPMWELSMNFADTVVVARKLGMRYIWIDSLCIIQDSLSDWNREAATMHEVYKYAEVTIAATSTTSAHGGFLERSLDMVQAIRIGYSLGEGSEVPNNMIMYIRDNSDSGSLIGDIESSPWNRRGWTMQERSLSTRILHFCKNKLYFECRSCIATEENDGFQDLRFFQMWPRNEDWIQKATSGASEAADAQPLKQWYGRWASTVSEYCRRNLTKDSDKLPAIQGIAAEMSTNIHDTYIPFAGMWRKNMKHDLLWQVGDGPVSIPPNYRAPTWSWASLNAQVTWIKAPVSPESSSLWTTPASFEIVDIGERNSGTASCTYFLTARALLKPIAFLVECDGDERWVYGNRGIFPHDLFARTRAADRNVPLDSLAHLSLEARQREASENPEIAKFAEGRLDLDDKDGLTTSQRRLFYLHVDSSHRPSGLILESVEQQIGDWKRVGVATVFGKWSDAFWEHCLTEEAPIQVTIL